MSPLLSQTADLEKVEFNLLEPFPDDIENDEGLRDKERALRCLVISLVSVLLHFFVIVAFSPFFARTSETGPTHKVLDLLLVKHLPEVESQSTLASVDKETSAPNFSPSPVERIENSRIQARVETLVNEEEKVQLTKDLSALNNSPSEPSTWSDRATIFDPRLRQRFYHSDEASKASEFSGQVRFHNMQYYSLGNGDCIREHLGGYGISNTNSEEYLMMNVRKVACPGERGESEGEAILRGLRSALK